MTKYKVGDVVRDPDSDYYRVIKAIIEDDYTVCSYDRDSRKSEGSPFNLSHKYIDENYTVLISSLNVIKNKYDRKILGKDGKTTTVDVYRVLDAFEVTNPQLQHLAKKALCAGLRGHKDFMQDLKDIELAIKEAIKMEEQK